MNCINDTISLGDDKCPPNGTLLNKFTEVIVCDDLIIPPNKPPKDHIAKVLKKIIITDYQEVKVDLGDGIKRKKVVVTGTIKLGIEYSADEPEQQVHFARFELPFQGIIGYRPCDPSTNRGLIDENFSISNYKVHVCVEHEQYHQLSPRLIKAVIVLLIWLEPKQSPA